jgi:hypothetical protein
VGAVLFRDFLRNAKVYDQAEACWQQMWHAVVREGGQHEFGRYPG